VAAGCWLLRASWLRCWRLAAARHRKRQAAPYGQ
jgi:hypothetical protein